MRGPLDRRKRLGERIKWTCGICGRIIEAHTTTWGLATLQHKRAERRRGIRTLRTSIFEDVVKQG